MHLEGIKMTLQKSMCVIGFILSFIGLFFLSWFIVIDGGTTYYAWGIGVIRNILGLFMNPAATMIPAHFIIIYIIGVFYILVFIAPFFMLGGIKSSGSGIFGGVMVLILAVILIFAHLGIIPNLNLYLYLRTSWDAAPILAGYFPFHVFIGGLLQTLGGWVILFGGAFGFIGGLFGPSDSEYQ